MEQMKVSSVMRAYPDRFVVAMAMERDECRRVVSCRIMGVFYSKEKALSQQDLFSLAGMKTFLIPTFRKPEDAMQITIANGGYISQPLLSPSDNARMFRQYYDLE